MAARRRASARCRRPRRSRPPIALRRPASGGRRRGGIPDSAPPARRPGRRPGAPRIDFFGDSVAWTLGTYLPPQPQKLTVSVRAVQGCGIARLPELRYLGEPHPNYPGCEHWDDRWRRGVRADDPDVAVILLDRWELMDRKLDGRWQHVGDPAFDPYLTGELDRAIAIAAERGAHVALLTAPYTHRAERPDGGLWPEDGADRVDAWNRLLRAAAERHGATVLDLNRRVCPDGRFTWAGRRGAGPQRRPALHPGRRAGVDRPVAAAPALPDRRAGRMTGGSPCGAGDRRITVGGDRRCRSGDGRHLFRLDLAVPVGLGRAPALVVHAAPPVAGDGERLAGHPALDPQQPAQLLDEAGLAVDEGVHRAGRELQRPAPPPPAPRRPGGRPGAARSSSHRAGAGQRLLLGRVGDLDEDLGRARRPAAAPARRRSPAGRSRRRPAGASRRPGSGRTRRRGR